MKMNNKQLNSVAGGKIIESKDGKFFVMPEDTLIFENEDQAKGAEMILQYFSKQKGEGMNSPMGQGFHGHMGRGPMMGHGPMGRGSMGQNNMGPMPPMDFNQNEQK